MKSGFAACPAVCCGKRVSTAHYGRVCNTSGGGLRETGVSPLPCRKLQIARAEPLTTPPGFAIIIMLCGRGGIGIRVRLRGVSVTGYGFKSRRPHHSKYQLLIQRLVLFLCLMAGSEACQRPLRQGLSVRSRRRANLLAAKAFRDILIRKAF